jgi:hypothetical protein
MPDPFAPLTAIAQRGIPFTAPLSGTDLPDHPCDASCEKAPQDASQNLDLYPQPIETEHLTLS